MPLALNITSTLAAGLPSPSFTVAVKSVFVPLLSDVLAALSTSAVPVTFSAVVVLNAPDVTEMLSVRLFKLLPAVYVTLA